MKGTAKPPNGLSIRGDLTRTTGSGTVDFQPT